MKIIEKKDFVNQVLQGYDGYSNEMGVKTLTPNEIVEFKIGSKFGYRCSNNDLAKSLENTQLRALSRVVNTLEISKCATAFVTGSSYLDFLEPHRYSYHFIRLDIKDFFHSISSSVISESFSKHFKDTNITSGETKQTLLKSFLNLVTYTIPPDSTNKKFAGKTILPIGFRTSPAISNIVFRRLDCLIEDFCYRNNVTYTRYADDMLFSSKINTKFKSILQKKDVLPPIPITHKEHKTRLAKIKREEALKHGCFLHSDKFTNEISSIIRIINLKLNIKKTIKSNQTISLNGYTIDGVDSYLSAGTIRVSNKKLNVISKIIHSLNKNMSAIEIMERYFKMNKAHECFKYPPKYDYYNTFCIQKLFNKITGYRSYLVSLIKYDEEYNCITPSSLKKYKSLIAELDKTFTKIKL
ncbi:MULTISPECIES: reverse transcriptase domain-containing protein [unclassified Shewanella]|uniref:reverse transcriptase domain-containing protein n=1 Tax=unclassified Shewanella TaxID=196818 RepID=UPI001BBDA825|nr:MULTISPECIES: reverse transcriptase domain-containing protein [unclassified Shewanella]GIU21285.1 reverse transcriptase [Shewanella sp. MBTL60-112-B1]GIU33584.1 reverse transcriptase [Shewanella sp. MBTL60-112-B2]